MQAKQGMCERKQEKQFGLHSLHMSIVKSKKLSLHCELNLRKRKTFNVGPFSLSSFLKLPPRDLKTKVK